MSVPTLETPPGPITQIDGREYLYFVGTGYLGLQGHPEVIRAACEATQRYGIHSGTTRAGFGNTPPTLLAERRTAEFFGVEAAFYFASGYASNGILLSTLKDGVDAIFVDELAHYSVAEAAQQSGRPVFSFHHRDTDDLAASLRKNLRPGQRPLVMTDGVFSALGTIAPVAEYRDLLHNYAGAALLVDDAHAIGVLGERGRGTFEYAGLCAANSPLRAPTEGWSGEGPGVRAANRGQQAVGSGQRTEDSVPPSALRRPPSSNPQSPIPHPASASPHPNPLPKGEGTVLSALPKGEGTDVALFLSGTMSKAIGGFGGVIPGSLQFIERVKKASHWYDGASAPVAAAAAATARAIEMVMAEPAMRTRLWSNVRRLKDGLRGMGFGVDQTPVPIIALTVGTAENMQRIQRELMARGIAVAYMAAYSGLGSEGALRIAVFATHTESMIGQFLDELKRLV